jgi:hypothetical protein
MNLKEMFTNTRTASQLGTSRFRFTMNRDAVKTPHYIMNRVAEMIEDRPSINSGLRQITMFVCNDILFKSKDPNSVKLAESWLQKRPWLKHEIETEIFCNVGFGTSYLEPLYRETSNGQKIIDNFYAAPDPSVIFRNPNADDDSEDYWILALSTDITMFAGRQPKHHRIHYIRGKSMHYETIWGLGFPKEKYIQRTYGWSRYAYYGWGELCSAVDNDDVLREIIKNWALMAKYRALGKKIIGFYNENGDPIDPSEIDSISNSMAMLEEEDSLLVNKKFVAEDLTHAGQDSTMMSEIDFIRKENTSATVPNYMTAFSEDGSFATAREARVPFSLKLTALQNAAVEFYNDVIVESIRKAYPHVADDLTIDFGKTEVYSREELFQMYSQLYNMGLADGNEVREAAGLESKPEFNKKDTPPPTQFESTKLKESLKLVEKTVPKQRKNVSMKVEYKESSTGDKKQDSKKVVEVLTK